MRPVQMVSSDLGPTRQWMQEWGERARMQEWRESTRDLLSFRRHPYHTFHWSAPIHALRPKGLPQAYQKQRSPHSHLALLSTFSLGPFLEKKNILLLENVFIESPCLHGSRSHSQQREIILSFPVQYFHRKFLFSLQPFRPRAVCGFNHMF